MTDSNSQLPAKVDQPNPKPVRTWPLWLLVIIALALSVAVAYWGWLQWQKQQSLEQKLSDVAETTQRLENNDSQSGNQQSQRLQSLENRLAEQREMIATQQRQIDHNARELLETGDRTRTDWLLAEAEYLLRIANQRLLIEKDYEGALAVLKSADEVLAETDDVGVYPVRQQLAREIMALKSIAGVDRTGLYLQLEAAIETVQNLTDSALPGDKEAPEPQAADAKETDDNMLKRAWHQTRETLASMVVIRRLDEPARPMLSPEQSAYARLNIQLMLEEAELALLGGDQMLYERALAKARESLGTWYDESDERIRALQSTLRELSDKNISPDLPDISKSLNLLKARLEGRLNDTGDSDGGNQGEPAEQQKEGQDAGTTDQDADS